MNTIAWPKGDTTLFVDQCMDRNAMADLATRLASCKQKDHSLDAILRLTENGDWAKVLLLADFDKAIAPDKGLPIDLLMAKQVKKASQALENCLESHDLPKTDFGAVECAANLLDCHPDYKLITRELFHFFGLRHQLIISLPELEDDPKKLARALQLFNHIPGPLEPSDHLWAKTSLRQKLPGRLENLLKNRGAEDRLLKSAEALLISQNLPKAFLSRKDLAIFLFRRGLMEKKLPDKLQKAYDTFYPKAQALQRGCNLQLLRTKSPNEAKKILSKLHLIQCLAPPSALIDFSSAYFEFRFIPPSNDPEGRQRGLLQAESQLPKPIDWLSGNTAWNRDLQPYILGLNKRLAQTKAEFYLKDERADKALDEILKSLPHRWPWSLELICEQADTLLPHLETQADDDHIYLTNLLLASRAPDIDSIKQHIQQAASTRFDLCTQKLDEKGDDSLFEGVCQLSRALQLGFPEEDAKNIVLQFSKKLEEANKKNLQNLSLKVGSALGDALSTRSIGGSDSPTPKAEIGVKLEKLYENFRDVMLQQDPFAKESQQALKEILSKTSSLIEEAKSIEKAQSTSVYDDILGGEDKTGSQNLLTDADSIRSLLEELYLEEDDKAKVKNASKRRLPPEQILMQKFSDLIIGIVSRQIKVKNNPLLNGFGDGMLSWISNGVPDSDWWLENENLQEKAKEHFKVVSPEGEGILKGDRYILCRVFDWLKFESEEALKVPYRKAMSVACSHITNGIVVTREEAQEHFDKIISKLQPLDSSGQLIQIIESMRKARAQIGSLEVMKNSGVMSLKFDRSIEPRVRDFLETCSTNLQSFGKEVSDYVLENMPIIEALDRTEFHLGTILSEKEKDLKRYLHMNLEELTSSYLRESNRGSLQSKVSNVCLRAQQGINFRRSDARGLRYSPVIFDDDHLHTPESIQELLIKFEEMFPIIDRISGSRQIIGDEELVFAPGTQGLDKTSLRTYLEVVDRYLENALKLARQLRIIIIPGQGTGNYDPTTNSLCIPLHTGNGRSPEMTILTALADYLFHVKVLGDGGNIEEDICEVLSKKGKSTLKPGSHDAKLKITQLMYQELGSLAGLDRIPRNTNAISSLLGQAILGKDNTMIYREMRDLSAPQKQQRYKSLRARYSCEKKSIRFVERVAEVANSYLGEEAATKSEIREHPTRIFHRLVPATKGMIRDELYDLGVLMYHYRAIDEAYATFELLTQLEPEFPEGYWGLATSCRHAELTIVNKDDQAMKAISAYNRFATFPSVGAFWKRRSKEMAEKMGGEL